jgi:DnaK suppressor protein
MTVRLKARPVQAAHSVSKSAKNKKTPVAKAAARGKTATPVRRSVSSAPVKEFKREKLESFRKQLTSRREALAKELSQATANFISDEVTYSDALDQAAADVDKSFALQMSNRERNILWQIDAALKRIDLGTYGSCERCAESITEARMNVFPFTTLCIDCKAEIESEQHRFSARG